MDSTIFVQNIKKLCAVHGIKPTVACRESGAGSSFINDIERGRTPSVAKVQLLAQYLGVTTSELLGEEKGPDTPKGAEPMDDLDARLMELVSQMSPEQKNSLIEKMEFLISMQ